MRLAQPVPEAETSGSAYKGDFRPLKAWSHANVNRSRSSDSFRMVRHGQRAVALNASSSVAHVALGWAALLNKHYVQAEAEVERSLALSPGAVDLYAGAASILNWVGRPAEALKLMEQALHLNPRLPSWYFFLGQAYYVLGRTEEAITPLQRVLSVYPHRVNAHVLLAAAYSELGQAAEARAEAAEVLRLNPKFSLEVHKQRAPIKDPSTLERHITALRKAGLK